MSLSPGGTVRNAGPFLCRAGCRLSVWSRLDSSSWFGPLCLGPPRGQSGPFWDVTSTVHPCDAGGFLPLFHKARKTHGGCHLLREEPVQEMCFPLVCRPGNNSGFLSLCPPPENPLACRGASEFPVSQARPTPQPGMSCLQPERPLSLPQPAAPPSACQPHSAYRWIFCF